MEAAEDDAREDRAREDVMVGVEEGARFGLGPPHIPASRQARWDFGCVG